MMLAESAPSDFSWPMMAAIELFGLFCDCVYPLCTRWPWHARSLLFAVVQFVLILCSNPAIAGDGSALVPSLSAFFVQCLSTAHETVPASFSMPALPTVLLFDCLPNRGHDHCVRIRIRITPSN